MRAPRSSPTCRSPRAGRLRPTSCCARTARACSSALRRELDALAEVLQAVTRGFDRLLERSFPYVMVLHQAPCDGRAAGHLHVEFYPPLRSATKLKYLAGCEQGAGTFVMDVLPEASAAALRQAIDAA